MTPRAQVFIRLNFQAIVLIGTILALPTATLSEDFQEKFVLCRNGKAVRTIRIEKDPNDGEKCVTTYTKGGKDEIVGGGRKSLGCVGVLDRVRGTLEKNFWKCHDVANHTLHKF